MERGREQKGFTELQKEKRKKKQRDEKILVF